MLYFRPQTWVLLFTLIGLLFAQAANSEIIEGNIWANNGNSNSWPGTARSTPQASCQVIGAGHIAYFTPSYGDCGYYECYSAPGGYYMGGTVCSNNPCTASEQHYDSDTGLCVDPPPPPPPTDAECVADHGPGWVSTSIQVGDETYHHCALPFPDNQEEDCSTPLGTVTYNGVETVVCGDDSTECSNTGGVWGTWGEAGAEHTGCLPPDTGDHLPTCSSTGAFVADGVDSFVCESPTPLPEQPNHNEPNEIDTDGDGTPDKDDSDLDGDGLPNSTDPDRDGDGIPNEDDLTPDGESTEEPESSVDGGADCLVAPRCTGDAVQCAILYQAWKTRCDSDDPGTEEIPDGTQQTLENNLDASGDTLLDGVETSFTDSIGDGDAGIVGATNLGDDVSGVFDPGACSDVTWSGPSGTSITISCTKTQKLRDILAIVVSILTLVMVFNIAMKGEVK